VVYLAVSAYCLVFISRAVGGHFAPDDLMNMVWYWNDGFWRVLWHNFTFWSTAYRPLGGLYYLPIYAAFKLNSVPYRLLILATVLANACLSCRLAHLLTGSRSIALVTGILGSAHVGLMIIYYANSSIYDILAYFFTMLILIRYIVIRRQGRLLSGGQIAMLAALFILALDAKEMSVVIPGFVLSYEIFFHGTPWDGRDQRESGWIHWSRREGLLSLLLILLAAIYTAGKIFGPHALSQVESVYKIHISRNLYTEDNLHYLNELFYTRFFDRGIKLFAVNSILLLGVGLARKSPALRWTCFFLLTATLPISIIPIHGNNALYIPLFGWSLLAGMAVVKIAGIISPAITWSHFEIPRTAVRTALVIALVAWAGYWTADSSRYLSDFFRTDQQPAWSAIQQFASLPFRPRPHSSVLILKDPFPGYEAFDIAELTWNDHSLNVHLGRDYHAEPTAAEIATYDSVLTFEGGELKVLRDGRRESRRNTPEPAATSMSAWSTPARPSTRP